MDRLRVTDKPILMGQSSVAVNATGASLVVIGPAENRRALTFSNLGGSNLFLTPGLLSVLATAVILLNTSTNTLTLTYEEFGSVVQGPWAAVSGGAIQCGVFEVLEA